MPNTSLIKFTPDDATGFVPFIRHLIQAKHLQTIFEEESDAAYVATGCLEGEMAFALAITNHHYLADAIQACQTALLIRLGLSDTPLSPAQSQQRRWIMGLFGALATSVDD